MGHMINNHWWGMGFGHGIWMWLFWGILLVVLILLIKYLFDSK